MESVIKEIFSQSVEIMLLVFSLLGLVISLLLTLSPNKIERLSNRLDKGFDVDTKLGFLDRPIQTGEFVRRHHIFSGSVLVLGSLFLLVFIYYRLDFDRFAAVFLSDSRLLPLHQIVYATVVTAGKVAGVVGMMLGVVLLFAAGRIIQLESKMATPVKTQPIVDRLNKRYHVIDRLLLTHPRVFGIMGMLASVFLLLVFGDFLMRG